MRSRPSFSRNQQIRRVSFQSFQLSNPKDFDEMTSIIQKSSGSRSEIENYRLRKTFQETFPFFQKVLAEASEETISTLVQEISFEFHPRRKTLFEIGDSGSKFYLILKGSVYVLARQKGLEGMSEQESPKESPKGSLKEKGVFKRGNTSPFNEELVSSLRNSSPLARQQSIKFDRLIGRVHSITKAKSSLLSDDLNDEELFMLKYPNLYIDRVMLAGEALGELALRHKDSKRMATIVCKDDCYFGVISKNAFQKALQSHFDKEMKANLVLFRTHPLFTEWEDIQLEQFYQHVMVKSFNKSQNIYEEGQKPTFFYLIKEGMIEISKRLIRKKENKSKKEDFKTLINKISAAKDKKELRLRVSILERGEIFGLEEKVSHQPRNFQAKCISASAILYCVAKEKFHAYANDFRTLTKALEMKRNVEEFRTEFVENTVDFLKNNSVYSYDNSNILRLTLFQKEENQRDDSPIVLKRRSSKKETQRKKFIGMLHVLDRNFTLGNCLDLKKKIAENKHLTENLDFFNDLIKIKKPSKSKQENDVSGFYTSRGNHNYYDMYLNETMEKSKSKFKSKSKEKISLNNQNLDYSKPKLNFVNLLDCSPESEGMQADKTSKARVMVHKKHKNQGEYFLEPASYFPKIAKSCHHSKPKNESLSLSGTSINCSLFLKPS